jgi:hypothetical protein
MALPLTVKTETALAYRPRCLPNQDIGQVIGILPKGGDLHTQNEDIAARREPEATITPTGLEATHEGSKSIMKMMLQAPSVVLNYPMMI